MYKQKSVFNIFGMARDSESQVCYFSSKNLLMMG